MKVLLLACLAGAVLCGCRTAPTHGALPQRALFGRHAYTTERGRAAVELGAEHTPEHNASAVPARVSVGLTETAEAFADFTAWNARDVAGVRQTGLGDLTLGYRERFWESPDLDGAAGAQFELKLPSADRPLGSGKIDGFGALMYTRRFSRAEVNLYYQLGLLGDPNADDIFFRHGVSLSGGLELFGGAALFAETSAEIDENQSPAFALVGLALPAGERVLLDAGGRAGLSSDAPDYQIFAGLTLGLGRVF